MSTRQRPLGVRISERSHGNCSPGYLWLRERVGRLRKRMAVRYPPYDEVAAEMGAEGIRGGQKGREVPLTGKAVRRMWERAVRDADEDQARRPPKRQMPPPGWRPEPVEPPAVVARPRPGPPPPPAPRPTEAPDPDVQVKLDAVMRQLERDGAWMGGGRKR